MHSVILSHATLDNGALIFDQSKTNACYIRLDSLLFRIFVIGIASNLLKTLLPIILCAIMITILVFSPLA